MSNKIGRFEILSDITHSDIGGVFKASDTESGKTVALKTLRLEPLGELGPELVKSVLEETEAGKVLNSHNIAVLYGTEEIEGNLCASMEYVQGNSVATMLARKEGFSIWDLQDIARQSCQGLDHAHAKGIFHYSLEPAKIMVSWDGTVKALSFGVSKMGAFAVQAPGKAPEVLHYMSPEQLRGLPVDARSNLFSLGTILYEMVTERKAFDGDDADQVRQAIMEQTPAAPYQVNRKIHPALSEVIMKALAKAPEERYASGQDLVTDLERCKEAPTKAAPAAKAAQAPPKAAAPPKPAGSVAPVAKSAPAAPAIAKTAAPKPAAKAAAAAAGQSANAASPSVIPHETPDEAAAPSNYGASEGTVSAEPGLMSSAETEAPEAEAPQIAVDPMMSENRQQASHGPSFSEIDELPPLKEVHVAPPPPPAAPPEPVEQVRPVAVKAAAQPEKPKIQPREVAKKAVTEIKKTPPQLFAYSIAGAIAVILLIVAGIAYHIHSQDSDDDRTAAPPAAANDTAANTPAPAAPAPEAQAPAPVQATAEPPAEPQPAVSVQPKYKGKKRARAAAAPSIVPGALSVTSTPAGAQIQIDGQSNSSWVTPYDLSGVTPGQHTLTISKGGYSAETRILEVGSGSKSFVSVQLTPLTATVSANSDPAGAEIWMDGKDTGRTTPAQIAVDKPGSHNFVFKKDGYLDESTSANLQMGQTTHISPTLRVLGNTDDIRIGGGKLKKMFGGADTAGMGTVSVKTQPKGAQVAVNNRMLDKLAPVEFHLDPGNYVIDITLSGFKSIHRVITVEKNGKTVIDDVMDRQ